MNVVDPVEAAAEWLAAQAEPPSHVVPLLRHLFGLSAKHACQVIAVARGASRTQEDPR